MKTSVQLTHEAFKSINADWKLEMEISKTVRQIEKIKLVGRVDLLQKFESKLAEILKNYDLKLEDNRLTFASGYSVPITELR